MPRKVKIILNPMADMHNAWRVANDLRPVINQYGGADWSGTVYPTHATALAKQAGEQGYDLVIAMGGDGTVHEVVNGLMQVAEDRRPILGVVPVGSGNDFAHAMGVPLRSDQALAHALSGAPTPVDIGVMTDEHGRKEYFDNTLGIGFDAVVTIRSHKLPLLRGFVMYLTAVIQTIILNHDPARMQMQMDGQAWTRNNLMLVVCNGPREGGGFLVAPDARPDDGILHYAMIEDCSRLTMFRIVPEVMRGTHGRFKQVALGSCKTMSVSADRPLYIHADGEIYSGFGSNLRQLTLEVLPGALKVVRG
ncbi:MAG TPA: diacylglycerol kinase family protein [Anaerolineales bacterium]|nr:diacylglycerol kinase family protein [Anaerolineales bacterium]